MDIMSVDRSIRHWWVFLLRGILFVTVGIYMVCAPGNGYAALGFLFGLTIFVTGIGELLRVYQDRSSANRGWHLFLGIIDLIVGGILMGHIMTSEVILRVLVGLWFLMRGLSLLFLSGLVRGSWLMATGGLIVCIFAGMIIFNASFGAMTVVILTAIAFILTGLFNIMIGYGMKRS